MKEEKWEEKQTWRYFKRQIRKISHEKTVAYLRRGKINRENESLLLASQNYATSTTNVHSKWISRNKITNLSYMLIEMKQLVIW